MSLKAFYEQKSATDAYNLKSRSGLIQRNGYKKLLAFDDRFLIMTRLLSNLIKKHRGKNKIRILDVGCGDGVYESLLPEQISNMAEFFGVDLAINQINKSRNLFVDLKSVDLDHKQLPYNDNSFDLIICSEVLEHLFFPDKVITECNRVLKKNGYLLLTVPNVASLPIRLNLIFRGYSRMINYSDNNEHIRFYSVVDIDNLTKNKFRMITVSGIGSLLFARWNAGFLLPMPRVLQIIANKYMPTLANGILFVLRNKK